MLTIYRASAGSGKTFTLAFEYIKILLGLKQPDGRYVLNGGDRPLRERHRALLAITFTKAATAEMKSRIISALHKLANIAEDKPAAGETPYAAMLTDLYGCSRRELRQAAERSLRDLLNDYGRFHVSTIDSFFQSVLRTFAREIDHQGDYDLALNRLDVIRQSVSLMLESLNMSAPGKTDRVYQWLRRQVDDKVGEGQAYNVFDRNGSILRQLTENMNKALNETFVEQADGMRTFMADSKRVDAFRKYLSDSCKLLNAEIIQTATRARDTLINYGLWEIAKDTIPNRLTKFIERPADIEPQDFKIKAIQPLIDNPEEGMDLSALFRVDAKRKITDEVREAIMPPIEKAILTAWRNGLRLQVLDKMSSSLVELEFIVLVQDALEEFLRENNTMLIADSGELLSKIISDAETPFIYERMGMELESLLIDEFQDTSRMQWKNLKPLVANSLGEAHDNLIIGDVKQAIYRFRNSDPTLLGHTVSEEDFPAPMHSLRGDSPAENTNHRSSHEVVRFNNTLFSNLAADLKIPGYSNVVQELTPKLKDAPGYVRFESLAPPPKDDKEKWYEDIFDQMAEDIRRQHQAGYDWRDIMILTRRNNEANEIVSHLLSKHPDIRILSNEALLLRNSQAVRAVMGILEMAENVRAEPPANCPYGNRETIAEFNNRCHIYADGGLTPAEAILQSLRDVQGKPGRSETIDAVRRSNPTNVVVFLENIIAEFPQDYRDNNQAYLAALVDKAIEHCQSSNPSISAFVESYRRNANRWAIQGGDGIDAVRVMTIHGSKGLESPCVHIPLADWDLQGDEKVWLPMDVFDDYDREVWPPMLRLEIRAGAPITDKRIAPEFEDLVDRVSREAQADTLNQTYVAFTRAGRELIVRSPNHKIGVFLKSALVEACTATSDPRLIDLTEYTESTADTFTVTIGEPTRPVKAAKAEAENANRLMRSDKAAPYSVFRRDDSRELVSIDDIFSEDVLNGDESAPEIVDRPDGSPESLAAATRGNALHAILGMMRTIDDLDAAVDRYRDMGRATGAEAEQYRADLKEAFDNAPEEVLGWFAPECEIYSERSIYEPATGRTYRPDRVVKLPSGRFAVIDYKFTTRSLPSHRRQVHNYVSLIEQLEPATATAHLWYPLLRLHIPAGE